MSSVNEEDEVGGGASESTEPAAGSSTGTDVSLKEFTGREDYWVQKYSSRENFWLDRYVTAEIQALRRETQAANKNAEQAVAVAAVEATKRLEDHNGLIEQMRTQASHFASREIVDENKKAYISRFERLENFQSKIIGGMVVLGAIGVANLVKLWTG